MSASQRKPNAEARKEDDLQYGHGPMSKDELEAKSVLLTPVRYHANRLLKVSRSTP